MNNMSPARKIILGILITFLSICFFADAIYIVLKFCVPEKVVVNTYNVSDLIVVDEDGTSHSLGKVMEVNYYANEDKSGVELFDLKLNTLKNEQSENTFSSGIQLVSYDEKIEACGNSGIKFDKGLLGIKGTDYYYKLFYNCNEYFYNCDGSNISYTASLSINDDDYFLITIGEEKFRMTLKNFTSEKLAEDKPVLWATNCYFAYGDWNYLAHIILNSIRSLPYGYDGTLTLKFGDLFDYYAYNEESHQYNNKTSTTSDGSLITQVINNYYTVKVNTYYSGARVATDSLFNMIEEDYAFNLTDSSVMNDYYLERQIIDLDQYDFDFIQSENNLVHYDMKLKDNIKEYLSTKNRYVLRITIDTSVLLEQHIGQSPLLIYDDFLTEDLVYKVVYV